VANGGRERGSRESRERARLYQARQEFHAGQARRRTRDNLIAGIAGGVLVVGVLAVQTAYFVTGPGAPAPAPTATSTPGMTPTPTSTPTPTTSATPTPTPTPTP
jgi:hypothetical protein